MGLTYRLLFEERAPMLKREKHLEMMVLDFSIVSSLQRKLIFAENSQCTRLMPSDFPKSHIWEAVQKTRWDPWAVSFYQSLCYSTCTMLAFCSASMLCLSLKGLVLCSLIWGLNIMRNYSIFTNGFCKETVGMKFDSQISTVSLYTNEELETKV